MEKIFPCIAREFYSFFLKELNSTFIRAILFASLAY